MQEFDQADVWSILTKTVLLTASVEGFAKPSQ